VKTAGMKDVKRKPNQCPDPESLAVYLEGQLTSRERALIEEHFLKCHKCRLIVSAAIKSEDSVVAPSNNDQS
jgi:anti-sigma factor ChrR (cupin superfamily)